MNKSSFFFCYNKKMFKYIHDIKKIQYITIAKNPTTDQIFSLFVKSTELQRAIDDYKKLNPAEKDELLF